VQSCRDDFKDLFYLINDHSKLRFLCREEKRSPTRRNFGENRKNFPKKSKQMKKKKKKLNEV